MFDFVFCSFMVIFYFMMGVVGGSRLGFNVNKLMCMVICVYIIGFNYKWEILICL